MSRILKWDGTEMEVPHELFLRSMRLTFSHWTKHAAMLAAGVLWIRHIFCQVSYIVTLYSEDTRALNFQNLFPGDRSCRPR